MTNLQHAMLTSLLHVLILFLVLYLIYWLVGKFVSGVPYQVIGIILAIVFIIGTVRLLGVAAP